MIDKWSRLLQLQACDQRIRQAVATLDVLRQSLASLREDEQHRAAELQTQQSNIDDIQHAYEHLSLQLDQVKAQLRTKRRAVHRCRGEHQEERVHREIVCLEAHKAALEGELRAVKTQLARATAILRQVEAAAAARRDQLRDATSTVAAQIATAEEELRIARQQRPRLLVGIDPPLLREYERIFSFRHGLAVVEVANAVCQGCRMRLPLQLYLELQRAHRLTLCPHCHRIVCAPLVPSLPQSKSGFSPTTSNGNGYGTSPTTAGATELTGRRPPVGDTSNR